MGGVKVHWQEQRSDRATQMSRNSWMNQTPGMMMISYVVGPQFQNFSVSSTHGDNLREKDSEGSEHQNTTEVTEKSGTDQQCSADPSGTLEVGEIDDEVNRPKKGRKKSKTQVFAKGALTTPVPAVSRPKNSYRGR